MSVLVSEVYDALISAGAPEDQARAAAAAIPIQDHLATRLFFPITIGLLVKIAFFPG